MPCWATTAVAWPVVGELRYENYNVTPCFPLVAARSSSLDLGTSSFLVILGVAGKGVRAYNVLFY